MVAESTNVRHFEACNLSDPYTFEPSQDLIDSDGIVNSLWNKLRDCGVELETQHHISHPDMATGQLPSTVHAYKVKVAVEEAEQTSAATRLQSLARQKKAKEEVEEKRRLAKRGRRK